MRNVADPVPEEKVKKKHDLSCPTRSGRCADDVKAMYRRILIGRRIQIVHYSPLKMGL
jgi:hypothetical protein